MGDVISLPSPHLFVVVECYRCGVQFAMTRVLNNYYRENHRGLEEDAKSFYCPNGHPMQYAQPQRMDAVEREADK